MRPGGQQAPWPVEYHFHSGNEKHLLCVLDLSHAGADCPGGFFFEKISITLL